MTRKYFTRTAGAAVAVSDDGTILVGRGAQSLRLPDDPALGRDAGEEREIDAALPAPCIQRDCGASSTVYALQGTDLLVCECPGHGFQVFAVGGQQ